MAEHTLYGKRKLCYTEVTDFTDFQGIGRDPLYKRFDSVYAVIEKNIDPQYRDFLAHPIYSNEDQILWYVREWNGTPCQYKDLSESEKAKYAAIKEKTIEAYSKICKSITGEDRQILAGALKYIDEDFMFCYDDKVVVVAWGMSPDSNKHVVKGAIMHDLKLNSVHKVRFIVGNNGVLDDKLAGVVSRPDGSILSQRDLPLVTPNRGYAFRCWDPNPIGVKVNSALTFTALYDEVPVEIEVETVNVTFVAGDGGSLSGATMYTINKGSSIDESQVPMPVPSAGYSFSGWDVPYNTPINADTTICALFNRDDVRCIFNAGKHGVVDGLDTISMPYGTILSEDKVPTVKANKGYNFVGWDKSPVGYTLSGNTTFVARYDKIPWYKRIWAWLTGSGCLKWLLWLLLILLLIWLLSYCLGGCESFGCSSGGSDVERNIVKPIDQIVTPRGDVIDNNGPIKDIVGDDDTLPTRDVVAPIIDDIGNEPPIISNPGVPDIVANRLNIYFEGLDVDLNQFVADLLDLYGDDECQVIGVDHNIPMLQILIDDRLRDEIRDGLNAKMPDYDFFVFDESIFSIQQIDTDPQGKLGWHLDAIDLVEGWEITKGSADVIVAVVDDGIDATHEMFKGRIVKPYNVFTHSNKLSVGEGHGTHVAGLAVGSDKNYKKGVSGVAPKCRLMPVQVFDNRMCTFSSLVGGIMYAINSGAHVINVSVGPMFEELSVLPLPDQAEIAMRFFKNEEQVWRRIISIANERNAIIVFSAGNNNILASIPPANRTNHTINVVAVHSHIDKSYFSNFGEGSNISAPGTNIYSSVPTNDYASMQGTSMAAPIVTGTVALMKSIDPDITVTDALYILQQTGVAISEYVPPMIQVDDALIALESGEIPDGPRRSEDNPTDKDYDVPVNEIPGYDPRQKPDPKQKPSPVDPGYKDSPTPVDPVGGKDYDEIRRMIEALKRKIADLEKQLPENQ